MLFLNNICFLFKICLEYLRNNVITEVSEAIMVTYITKQKYK